MNPPDVISLPEQEWRRRQQRHRERLAPIVEPHEARASRHEAHPIIDFLFRYYRFPPSRLMRWSPGWGVTLLADGATEWPAIPEGRADTRGWQVPLETFPPSWHAILSQTIHLQTRIAARPPRFGCHGLHEWAMVYRTEEVRHAQVPLRLTRDEIALTVESLPVMCSHFDAFRFFTPAARPLNRLQPTAHRRAELEQSGCLHANMDLYRWASRFYPWIDSDLIADTFLLALEIRIVDMRASPYDLRAYDAPPIRIETQAGRAEYLAHQAQFAARAAPLREKLLHALRRLENGLAAQSSHRGGHSV